MGITSRSAIALAAVSILSCINPSIAASNITCSDSLHMIVARASTEAPGEGIIGDVANATQQQIPGSDSVAVQYPATLGNYANSEIDGVKAMQALVMEYADACPGGKMALLGYSQGAQVVGDTLCGNSEETFEQVPPLASNYTKNIVAAIQFGDPSFVPGLPWDKGTSNSSGVFPRRNTTACKPYASVIESYCDNNDLYCASGSSINVHYMYVQRYGKVAADFIVSQYKAAAGSSSGSSTAAGSTKTSTAASVKETTMTMTMTSETSATATAATGASGAGASSSASSGLAGHATPLSAPELLAAGLLALFL